MARVTVVLDEIINLSRNSAKGEPRPAKAAALCELGGASGVAIQVPGGDITPRYERIIKSVKEVLGIPLALIVPGEAKPIERVIDLAPDMAVLCDYKPAAEDYIARLQVSNIIAALTIALEIDQVKSAAKMKADYVVLDAASYCAEKSLSLKVDMLNKISKVSALAERLSMGTIIFGPVTMADLQKLSKIEQIEEFFIGHEVISKALLYGLGKAINELKSELAS
jgi:pyridoxine 5-phosphate synthase